MSAQVSHFLGIIGPIRSARILPTSLRSTPMWDAIAANSASYACDSLHALNVSRTQIRHARTLSPGGK
jgi:hypothetical protein